MKKFIINNYRKYFILAAISIVIIPSLTAESFRSVRAESVGMSIKRLERLTEQLVIMLIAINYLVELLLFAQWKSCLFFPLVIEI